MQLAFKVTSGWHLESDYFSNNSQLNLGFRSSDSDTNGTRFNFIALVTAADAFAQRQNIELDITSTQTRASQSQVFEYAQIGFTFGWTNIQGTGWLDKVVDSRQMQYAAYPGQNTFTYSFGQSPVLMVNLDTSVLEPKVLYTVNIFVIVTLFMIVDDQYIFVDSEQGNINVQNR